MKERSFKGPCELNFDKKAAEIVSSHIQICKTAFKLAKHNPHVGYHQEPHVYFYDAKTIEVCVVEMKTERSRWRVTHPGKRNDKF